MMNIADTSLYHDKLQFHKGYGDYVDNRKSIAAIASDTSKTPDQIKQSQQAVLDSLSSDHLLNMATRPITAKTTDEEKKINQMAAQTLLNRGHTSFNGGDDKAALQSIANGNAPTDADRQFNMKNQLEWSTERKAAFGNDPAKAKDAAGKLLDNHADYFSADAIAQLTVIASRSNQV